MPKTAKSLQAVDILAFCLYFAFSRCSFLARETLKKGLQVEAEGKDNDKEEQWKKIRFQRSLRAASSHLVDEAEDPNSAMQPTIAASQHSQATPDGSFVVQHILKYNLVQLGNVGIVICSGQRVDNAAIER